MAPEYVSFLSPFMYLALMSEKTAFAVFQGLDEEDEDEDEDDEEVSDLSESLPLVFGLLAIVFLPWTFLRAAAARRPGCAARSRARDAADCPEPHGSVHRESRHGFSDSLIATDKNNNNARFRWRDVVANEKMVDPWRTSPWSRWRRSRRPTMSEAQNSVP